MKLRLHWRRSQRDHTEHRDYEPTSHLDILSELVPLSRKVVMLTLFYRVWLMETAKLSSRFLSLATGEKKRHSSKFLLAFETLSHYELFFLETLSQ